MSVGYAYDRLGTLRRIQSSNPGSGYSVDRFGFTFRQDQVDVLGRPLHQTVQCDFTFNAGDPAIPCRDWLPGETTNRYNRLGALAIQARTGTSAALDTLRYDRSGNLIHRQDTQGGQVTDYVYPSASNRLSYQRDSLNGTSGHSDRHFLYDAAGSRWRSARQGSDTLFWQYDVLSRLVGTWQLLPPPPSGGTVMAHLDECRWHPSDRLGQPCGNGGALGFVGENVTRSSLGWFFVHAPGIDEVLLLVHRLDNGTLLQRLQAVTDGRGQLLAIADSQGFISAPYAGSGYDQAAWQGAGLTSRAQTYASRRWETGEEWGGVQQFRHRAYDPATGTWIQEDPLGVAGGVNVYRFNNGNPVTFSDPMGMCPEDAGGDGKTDRYDDCPVGSSGYYAYLAAQGDNSKLTEIKGLVASCNDDPICAPLAIGAMIAGGASGLRAILNATRSAGAVGELTGFTRHGLNEVINRGVSPAQILDAIRSGAGIRRIDSLGRASWRFIGEKSTVVLNRAGEVITGWKGGWR